MVSWNATTGAAFVDIPEGDDNVNRLVFEVRARSAVHSATATRMLWGGVAFQGVRADGAQTGPVGSACKKDLRGRWTPARVASARPPLHAPLGFAVWQAGNGGGQWVN